MAPAPAFSLPYLHTGKRANRNDRQPARFKDRGSGISPSSGLRKIVERAVGHANDVVANECRSFARAILGMLQAAFPFEHGPAGIVVLRELAENALEIDPVSYT